MHSSFQLLVSVVLTFKVPFLCMDQSQVFCVLMYGQLVLGGHHPPPPPLAQKFTLILIMHTGPGLSSHYTKSDKTKSCSDLSINFHRHKIVNNLTLKANMVLFHFRWEPELTYHPVGSALLSPFSVIFNKLLRAFKLLFLWFNFSPHMIDSSVSISKIFKWSTFPTLNY